MKNEYVSKFIFANKSTKEIHEKTKVKMTKKNATIIVNADKDLNH